MKRMTTALLGLILTLALSAGAFAQGGCCDSASCCDKPCCKAHKK